jgi:hypothetical protein
MAARSVRSSRTGTAAAGAGTGTIAVAIANSLPTHSTLRTVLLYAAPSVSVAAGWLVAVLDSQVSFYQRRFVYNRTVKTLRATLQNPTTSEAHKEKIRSELEAFERKYAASETAAATTMFRIAGRR